MERLLKNNRLREFLSVHKIKGVLFDFDDTLIFTSEIFRYYMRQFSSNLISECPNLNFKGFLNFLEDTNNNSYKNHAVNPKRWLNVINTISQRLNFDGDKYKFLLHEYDKTIMQIYRTVPRIIPGAKETVYQFSCAGMQTALITHADEVWTQFKLSATGFDNFFPPNRVFVVDQDKHKGPEDWLCAVRSMGLLPEEIIAFGDSLPGDIRAAKSIGVSVCVWLPSEWVMYNDGNVPEGVITVEEGIGHAIEKLIENT